MEFTDIFRSLFDDLDIFLIKLCIGFVNLGPGYLDVFFGKLKTIELFGVFKKCLITVFPDICKDVIYD